MHWGRQLPLVGRATELAFALDLVVVGWLDLLRILATLFDDADADDDAGGGRSGC